MPGTSETRSGRRSGFGFSSKWVMRPWRLTFRIPKPRGLLRRNRGHRHRGVGHVPAVGLQHPPVVHLVELVAGEDEHVAAAVLLEVAQALAHRVRRALEPVGALLGLLRGQHGDEARGEHVELVGQVEVLVEALRVVLGEDEDPAQVRVQAVADRDVDEAVLARDGHRRLAALLGEGEEAGAAASAEDDAQHVVHWRAHSATRRFSACQGDERRPLPPAPARASFSRFC